MHEKEWLKCRDAVLMVNWLEEVRYLSPETNPAPFIRFVESMRERHWPVLEGNGYRYQDPVNTYLSRFVNDWITMTDREYDFMRPVDDARVFGTPADVLRDAFGNLFRPVSLTSVISETTAAILTSLKPRSGTDRFVFCRERLAVFADSLEDDGVPPFVRCSYCKGEGVIDKVPRSRLKCTHCVNGLWRNPLLEHLRGDDNHYVGCWALHLVEERIQNERRGTQAAARGS